jgi:segregation and condensation protein A
MSDVLATDALDAPPPMGEHVGDVDARPQIRAGTDGFFVEARGNFAESDVEGYMPSPESDRLRVKVSPFEGPLDLLLHLIEKHALDVFDIQIRTITEEYLKVVDDMRALDLDVAGEFLVMAATLAHIKSKLLLPQEERDDDDAPELDPRAALVRRLLEYQRFREAAQALDRLNMLGRDVFARPLTAPAFDGPVPSLEEQGLNLLEVDPFELIRLFDEMLRHKNKHVVHEVLVERISVGARINDLVDFMNSSDGSAGFSFDDVVLRFGARTRKNIIVTFLSVLEMARLKLLRFHQDESGRIFVSPVLENLRADDTMSEALASVDEFGPAHESEGAT